MTFTQFKEVVRKSSWKIFTGNGPSPLCGCGKEHAFTAIRGSQVRRFNSEQDVMNRLFSIK